MLNKGIIVEDFTRGKRRSDQLKIGSQYEFITEFDTRKKYWPVRYYAHLHERAIYAEDVILDGELCARFDVLTPRCQAIARSVCIPKNRVFKFVRERRARRNNEL